MLLGRVVSLPLDLLGALRELPEISRATQRMAEHTEVLEEVAAATGTLPELAREMTRVAEATELIAVMDGRMATIADAMPVLVEVQRHLAQMPELIERLDARITELSLLLGGLQESLEPLGRIARRLPGQREQH
jgi:hypothetical protein